MAMTFDQRQALIRATTAAYRAGKPLLPVQGKPKKDGAGVGTKDDEVAPEELPDDDDRHLSCPGK